ncbi:MAG: PHP domain-containing protein [Tissierellia bacterium]|nr:PHP domain-containing protein [Tissierellia bacterium]
MIFDLHVHTNCSDGLLTPQQVIDIAIQKGINGIAITDHDTTSALEKAIAYSKDFNFKVIPGIELGCVFKGEEVHILGYFIDYKSKDIIEATEQLRQNRISRARKMVERINSLGMDLTFEDVKEYAKDEFIGRPHIARSLIQKGYYNSMEEVFDELLERGKPAYIERKTLGLKETISLIHKVNGIAILAHPGLIKDKDIIGYCIDNGIDGLEVIHSKHKEEDVVYLLDIGRKHNLILTGGSDCHGRIINGDYLVGKYYVNLEYIPQMKGRL